MELKRNLLTVLYTIAFLFVTGFGLFQMTNLIVSTVPNKYVVTSIIILGLIIYLIVAFFVKEADALRFMQKASVLMILLECMIVLGCGGLFFYLQWMNQGMDSAVIYTLLLVSMYLSARFCGGRICGILCAILAFYMLITLSSTDLMTTGSAIDMLCFLLPFAVFTGFQRILIPFLKNSGFLLVASYLVLGFIFSLAIAINPLVCALLFGCVFSLIFASSGQKEKSVLARGVISALFLFVFTIGLLFCIYWMVPDIFESQNWKMDQNLPLTFRFETVSYVINKYTRPIIYLHLQYSYGILPILLFFFTFLAGYYTIRKKASYMGPLILSLVSLFAYYIVFSEGGSQFYSLYYLLLVFAVYGLSNTLLFDRPPVTENVVEEELEEESEEEPGKVMEEGLGDKLEIGPDKEWNVEPEKEWNIEPEKEWKVESEKEGKVIQKEEYEEKGLEFESPVVNELEEEPGSEQLDMEWAAPEPKMSKTENVKSVIPTVSKNGEIPEWTMPEEFVQKSSEADELVSHGEEVLREPVVQDVSTAPEIEDTLDLDEFVAEEPELELVQSSQSEPDLFQEEELISARQEEPADDLMLDSPETGEETDQIDMPLHDGSNDIEQFASVGTTDSDDSMLYFSENESDEAALIGEIREETEEETDANTEEMETVEEVSKEIKEEVVEEVVEESKEEVVEEVAEEEQLNDLLDRLDMSEPIKRMNESAREDIADVIEREEEQVELSEALPLKPSKSALPKYKKPNFDFEIEPISIPLDDQYSTISEYDEVPTVHDLENQWKNDTKPVIETVATKVEEIQDEQRVGLETDSAPVQESRHEEKLHSEQIVRKSGIGKRSYHKITIR